jgi:hypothetical protein
MNYLIMTFDWNGSPRRKTMRRTLLALTTLSAVLVVEATAGASAQVLNLSGQFQCVQQCVAGPPALAYVTQVDWQLNLVNEAGVGSRAWIDYPGHIWVQSWNEGAIYSPDGMTIQFDRGTVWQRDLAALAPVVQVPSVMPAPSVVPGPPVSARPDRNARVAPVPAERAPAGINAFDGSWSVVIHTQAGGCGPEYRYGVQIINGNIITDAGESTGVSGRVLRNGAVSVSVSAGGAYAVGQGRLSPTYGTGTWRGESSGESCSGAWQAVRRG